MSGHDERSRTEKFIDWYGAKLVKHKERIYLFAGLSLLFVHVNILLSGYYLNATIMGFMGWMFLGGWTTFKGFIRHPIAHVRHWYHVFRGTIRVREIEYPNGDIRISIRKATIRNGVWWREVRSVDKENVPNKFFE